MRPVTLRIGSLLLLLAAAGCGQKGPLYLPDTPRAPVPAAGGATPPAEPGAPAAPATPPTPTPDQAPSASPPATPTAAPSSGGSGS